MKKYILIFIILASITGCTEYVVKYIVDKSIKNADKIESFEGTVSEVGLLGNDEVLKTRVCYRKPNQFIAELLEPKDFKGDTFVFDGERIYMYYKSIKLGIEYTGLNSIIEDTEEKRNERTKKNLFLSAGMNKATWKKTEKVAGRKTYCFKVIPREPQKHVFKEYFWGDAEFSMILKLDLLNDAEEIIYSLNYDDISFNREIEDEKFKFKFPREATVGKWDLGGKGYSLGQVKKDMNFKVYLPGHLPELMEIKKVVKAPGFVPATCIVYYDGLYHLIVTEIKDYGLNTIRPRGIKIPEVAKDARLLFFGESVLISWKKKDVLITLSGNLPYHEMISIAESFK